MNAADAETKGDARRSHDAVLQNAPLHELQEVQPVLVVRGSAYKVKAKYEMKEHTSGFHLTMPKGNIHFFGFWPCLINFLSSSLERPTYIARAGKMSVVARAHTYS